MKPIRNINDDLIRVIALFLVILIHVAPKPWPAENSLPDVLFQSITSVCNCFFFLLSGKYNLRKSFSTAADYSIYYKKKTTEILVPYVIICFLLSAWNIKINGIEEVGIKGYVLFAFKELFSDNVSTHIWFMFILLGFLLSAPFFSKMLHAMSDTELHILFAIGLLWNFVTVYLFDDFGHSFSYSGWILSGWLIYFLAGYYIDRIMTSRSSDKFIIILGFAGIAGFIVNFSGMFFFPYRYYSSTDYAPAFTLYSIAVYAWISKKASVKNTAVQKVLSFIAKHSFTVYLIHFNIANRIVPLMISGGIAWVQYIAGFFVTLALSLAASIILDFLLDFVKKGLNALLNRS